MAHSDCAQPNHLYSPEQLELIEVDQRFQQAFIDKDIGAIDALLVDDYVLVSSNGSQRTKGEVLEAIASPRSTWQINQTRDWDIRIHGSVAIVVATLHQKGIDQGTPFDSQVRFSDTYVCENGQWRQLHAHASRITPVP